MSGATTTNIPPFGMVEQSPQGSGARTHQLGTATFHPQQSWSIPTNNLQHVFPPQFVYMDHPPLQISSHQQQLQQQHQQQQVLTFPTQPPMVINTQETDNTFEMRRLQQEFPFIYALLQQQQAVIEEQRGQIANATDQIVHLTRELSRINKCNPTKRTADTSIPPVILVEKDGYFSSKRSESPPLGMGTDSDTYDDSLPLKKRRRGSHGHNKQNLSKVLRILGAATVPSSTSSSAPKTECHA